MRAFLVAVGLPVVGGVVDAALGLHLGFESSVGISCLDSNLMNRRDNSFDSVFV